MADRRRGSLWLILTGAFLIISLLVASLFLLPSVLNLDVVKQRLVGLASEGLGVKLDYERAELALFPRPGIVIRNGSVTEPGEMEIRLEELMATTSLLPLLQGEFELTRIRVKAPTFKVAITGDGEEDPDRPLLEEIREVVDPVVSLITSTLPGLVVELGEGTFELWREDRPLFRAERVQARIDSRRDSVQVDLACGSRIWDGLSLKGSIGEMLKGELQIRLRGLASASLLEGPVPPALARLEPTDLDLDIAFDGSAANAFEGEFRGSLPSLRLQPPEPKRILEDLDFSGSVSFEPERTHISFDRLSLEFPRLAATVNLSIDSDSREVSLEAKGEGIDLLGLREVALTIGEEIPLVREVCHYVRGGEVSSVLVRSQGSSLEELVGMDSLDLEGRFSGVRVLVPDPSLELTEVGGEVALSAGLLEGKELRGNMGKSGFSGTALRLDLREVLYVQHLSGDLVLSLEEIHERLASLEGFQEATKDLRAVKGTVALRVRDLSGPLEKPDRWRYDTNGTLRRVLVETSLLPGQVKVTRGSFRANRDRILLNGVHVALLDANCMANGRLEGYRRGLEAMEWRLDGTVGPEMDRWASEQIELPGEFRLRTPYQISEALCRWKKAGDMLLRGTLVSPRGPRVSADLILKPGTVVLNELSIRDEKSMASAGLRDTEEVFSVTFRGRLDEETLDDLLVNNTVLDGGVEGDFETRILLDRPLDSRAMGTLRAEGLNLPLPLPLPVILKDFTLRAEDNKTMIEAARLTWEEQEFGLEGELSFSSEGATIDLDALAGDLDLGRINEALKDEQPAEEASPQADTPEEDGLESLRVGGVVRARADAFTFEQFTWRPLEVEILLGEDGLEILLKEANLCGVTTTGTVAVKPAELSLDLETMCEDKRIEDVLDCVQIEVEASGDFAFKLKIAGKGDPKDALQWLEGDFEVNAKDGKVFEDPVLSAVLALINTTEVFRLKLPDYSTKGFPYNSLHSRGTIQKGVLTYDEVVIDGATVDIYALGNIDLGARTLDFRVLVSPLQTVESVFSKIPLVSYLWGGRGVTAIPIRVHGPLDNVRTVPVSPSALGEDLLGIMGRTVGLPYAAIKWVLPKQKK